MPSCAGRQGLILAGTVGGNRGDAAARTCWVLVLGCFLLSLVGCARDLPTLEPTDLPVSLVTEKLEEKRGQLSSFRAVGALKVQSGIRHWSGRAFLLGRMPESLRLEVLSFLGPPLLYVVSDGNQFLTWVPGRNQAYQGMTAGNTLGSLLDFPLADEEALLLLAGIVPSSNPLEAKLFRERQTENLVLQWQNSLSQQVERVWLRAVDLTAIKFERFKGNKRQLEVQYTDFVITKEFIYPRSVAIEASGFSLNLDYKQFAVNDPLPRGVFGLALPEGVEVLPWSPSMPGFLGKR